MYRSTYSLVLKVYVCMQWLSGHELRRIWLNLHGDNRSGAEKIRITSTASDFQWFRFGAACCDRPYPSPYKTKKNLHNSSEFLGEGPSAMDVGRSIVFASFKVGFDCSNRALPCGIVLCGRWTFRERPEFGHTDLFDVLSVVLWTSRQSWRSVCAQANALHGSVGLEWLDPDIPALSFAWPCLHAAHCHNFAWQKVLAIVKVSWLSACLKPPPLNAHRKREHHTRRRSSGGHTQPHKAALIRRSGLHICLSGPKLEPKLSLKTAARNGINFLHLLLFFWSHNHRPAYLYAQDPNHHKHWSSSLGKTVFCI